MTMTKPKKIKFKSVSVLTEDHKRIKRYSAAKQEKTYVTFKRILDFFFSNT